MREAWRQDLIERHSALVQPVARKMRRRMPAFVEMDEMVSDGYIGLIDAADRFDAGIGSDFPKYAKRRIWGAILDGMRSRDHLGVYSRRLLALRQRETATGAVLMSDAARTAAEQIAGAGVLLSLMVAKDNCEEGFAVEPSVPATALDQAIQRQLAARLAAAIRRLNVRRQAVLRLYYHEEMTLREIGAHLGVNESRACQLLCDSRARLRQMLSEASPNAYQECA